MKTMEPGNVYILWNDENLLPEAGQESSGNDAAAKDTGDAEKECGINSEQTAPEEQQIPPKNQSFEGFINLATEICVAVIKRFLKKSRNKGLLMEWHFVTGKENNSSRKFPF